MKPYHLEKGDTIGVVAPSNSITKGDLEYINKSILLMESTGFQVEFGKHVFSNSTGYGASPKEKAEDLNNMFANPKIKAIFCAKGGEDSNTTFDYLDYETIKQNPKILCGFSDSTSILNAIYTKCDLVTFHGPTFKSLTSWDTEYSYVEMMKRLAKKELELGQKEDEFQTIQEGTAEGVLIGGNLSLFSKLICGKYQVDCKEKILFLEDLGYESMPQMVSSYFYYMKQNGVFDQIKGIWLGNYEHESNISIEKILMDCLEDGDYDFPIIKSNNFGHIDRKTTIPIGIKARIDTNKKQKIELLENCVI